MRVGKSDLDGAVVEDGETTPVRRANEHVLTTKNREINGNLHIPNGTHLLNGCGMPHKLSCQSKGGVVVTKPREPVEDCEDVDEGKEPREDFNVDSLTNTMKGFSIQETATLELESKLSELSVKDRDKDDKEEDDDTRCASLQSQSSVITVDPPSLPHEEEEEKGDVAEDLAPRGPTDGKPANFVCSNNNYNHISSKAYSSHNLDRFLNDATQFPPQLATQPAPGFGYSQPGYLQSSYYSPGSQMNSSVMPGYTTSNINAGIMAGKRSMEDDEDNPFKYTRPVEEVAFGSPTLNDLSGGVKKPLSFSQVSTSHGCGGQVLDNSPSPSVELSSSAFKFSTQISMTDVDSMLEALNAQEQASTSPAQLHSDVHKDAVFGQVQSSTKAGAMPSVPDYDPGYSSENSPHSETMCSPGSSPKSTFSPMRPPSNMSQDSGVASPFSDDMSSTVPSPPGDYSHSWVPEDFAKKQYTMPDSVQSTVYRSPASVSSVMSPCSADESSMASVPSPYNDVDSRNDYIFDRRKDELKDALDVIAADVMSMNDRKKANAAVVPPVTQKVINCHAPAVNQSVVPPNIPVSVTQQKNARPEKLPIAPLPKQGRSGMAAVQQQQQQSPMLQKSVPVMVVPSTMAVSSTVATTAAAPVTTSQPVLFMKPGQSAPVIVVVNNNQQPASQTPKRKPVPILPRPGPAISDSAPKPADAKSAIKTDLSSPKQEPCVDRKGACAVANGAVAGQNGARPASCGQPSPGSAAGRAVQGQPPSRMLNIARRLVASMTTKDLQFQDGEGDTYLHVSVCKADRNMVQALLERMTRERLQTMINTQNSMRQTPLYLAVSSNTPEMVELLIQYGADVNILAEQTRADGRSTEVKSALHCAASNGHRYLRTLQALLAARDLCTDQLNSDGQTALHCAILEHGKPDSEGGVVNNLPIIQALIKHGADPNAQGQKSGKTPLMYALESRDINLVEHMVALIDPARLRMYLKTQAFDGSTCQRIMESMQRGLDESSRQRLHTCFKINRRDTAAS